MRRHVLALVGTLGLAAVIAAVGVGVASAHSTPQIRAARAHQRAVLAEVSRIGRRLQSFEDQAQNAQRRLVLVKQRVRSNEYRLRVAKRNLGSAQRRLMARLYTLYVNGSPSAIEVLSGAHSFSQVIDRVEAAQALSSQDAALGRQTLSFERSVQARQRQLRQLEQKRERTVRAIGAKRRMVTSELTQQKRLLASIHTTISGLQAQEAARERAARLAAQERLQAELAARKARRERAAMAAAKARRRAQIAARKATQQAARARARQTQPAQRTRRTHHANRAHAHHARRVHHSSSAPTLTPPPPPPPNLPVGTGAGHPAAAQIALRYLGDPYVWGGSSPSGFDCSGLVMYVYDQLGISLPHYTVAQWDATKQISSPAPGDLVFFNGLGHVGIYIGNGQFVDAPHTGSVVRIDNIAGFGSYDGARRVP